jgi:hypothetical protein
MKVCRLFFVLFSCLIPIFNANGSLKLSTPDDLEIEQLNKDEKDKLENINYSETIGIPRQYTGKLKYTDGTKDVRFIDGRVYFGAGGRYSMVSNTKLTPKTSSYSKVDMNFKKDFNYFGSIGFYWDNGIRTEFEYSKSSVDTNSFDGSNFVIKVDNNYVEYTGDMTLSIDVKTYMINFIFEKIRAKTAIKPYTGLGVGVLTSNVDGLATDGKGVVPAAQIMFGLSYPIADGIAAFYLGYRGVFATELQQNFTLVTKLNGISVETKEKYKYNYRAHNIDLGLKFFF